MQLMVVSGKGCSSSLLRTANIKTSSSMLFKNSLKSFLSYLLSIMRACLGAGSVVDKSFDAFFFVQGSCSALQVGCLFAFGLVPGKFFDAFFRGSCSTGCLFDVRLCLDFCTTFDAIIASNLSENLSHAKLNRMS